MSTTHHDAPENPTAVLVGHCGFDSGGLTRLLRDAAPGLRVAAAHRTADLEAFADAGATLLINRLPEGDFQGRDGVALIAHLRQRNPASPARMLLVSNFPDAQAAAVAAGALPGFGKSDLHQPHARQRLLDALARP